MSPAPTALPGNGSNRKSAWSLVIPIAILALIIGTTLGEVWHRHVNTSPETCPICHLSHQAIEPAVASVRTEILVPEGRGPEPLETASVPRLVVPQLPARAPPA
ncbi:MAG TPA: hypothetical protein VFE06_17625 [Acidobacteriaceae bacterium]|nr:hypothetical protein [Acidobacteriaceae bacterium]